MKRSVALSRLSRIEYFTANDESFLHAIAAAVALAEGVAYTQTALYPEIVEGSRK